MCVSLLGSERFCVPINLGALFRGAVRPLRKSLVPSNLAFVDLRGHSGAVLSEENHPPTPESTFLNDPWGVSPPLLLVGEAVSLAPCQRWALLPGHFLIFHFICLYLVVCWV